MSNRKLRRLFLSERGLLLEYGNRIDPVIFSEVLLMASAIRDRHVDGVLNVLKPPGMTSHDVVDFIRKIYGLILHCS